MTAAAGAVQARALLALEGCSGPELAAGLARLLGADRFVLGVPGVSGRMGVAAGIGLEASQRLAAGTLLPDLDEHPALASLAGTGTLQETGAEGFPLAELFPEADWAAAVLTEERACGLFFGRGDPPREFFADAELLGALVRRVATLAGAERSEARLAAEALTRLSHEFKTPLVSIKGYAELLLDAPDCPLDPHMRDWVRRIAAGANRLAGLFHKITAESRSEVEGNYEPRLVALTQMVAWCLDEARVLAAQRDLDWSWAAEPDLPPVSLDPDAGRDVVCELLQNAARATPDGGAIQVHLGRRYRDGVAGVELAVVDSGIGIPGGEAAERVFDRFVRLESPLEHHSGDFEFGAGGLGLGLSLVRRVVEAHGGAVDAEARGRDPQGLPGCAIRLWLPAAAAGGGQEGEAFGAPGGHLLLVDPDGETRRILEASLGEHYQVVAVHSGATALAAWAAETPWAGCIVEPRLPDLAGVDLLRSLRELPGRREVPILVYAAAAERGSAALWRAAGADACLFKPVRSRALLQRLATVKARKTLR